MGGGVFGLHRRKRIAFCEKFGGAELGRVKEGVGRNKNKHFRKQIGKMDGANACLDRTGVSGSQSANGLPALLDLTCFGLCNYC